VEGRGKKHNGGRTTNHAGSTFTPGNIRIITIIITDDDDDDNIGQS
jgi:hypothetical protein